MVSGKVDDRYYIPSRFPARYRYGAVRTNHTAGIGEECTAFKRMTLFIQNVSPHNIFSILFNEITLRAWCVKYFSSTQ